MRVLRPQPLIVSSTASMPSTEVPLINPIAVFSFFPLTSVKNWLRDFIPKLKAAWKQLREFVPYGARIFGDLIVEGADYLVKIAHKLYYQEDGQWIEETTTRKIPESEVPPAIRDKVYAQQKEEDITEEIEEELGLEV